MYISVLNACGSKVDILKRQYLHAKVIEVVFVGNSLTDIHIKCDLIMEASMVFDELPIRDIVSWNVIASGYVGYGLEKQVFTCLEQIHVEGFPASSTL